MTTPYIIGLIGLGYVGLPVAVAMGQKFKTIGFDINKKRVEELKEGIDSTGQFLPRELLSTPNLYTSSPEELKAANFFIVAVPTPIDQYKRPDLHPLREASKTAGQVLKKGDIVVFESTVFPGATEEICLPLLEKESGLTCGKDFQIGYSPERVNPGDKVHTFTTIKKIISAQNPETLRKLEEVYGSVVAPGLFKATTIKVAEAAKLVENVQRDINVSLMNELSLIFHRLDIDTKSVLEAASSKWNFLPFTPGLVGGHCIGVDPYYLTFKAEEVGYSPQVILSGRRINDNMGKYIAERTIKEMILGGLHLPQSTVTVFGITFKENCPDIRNTKVVDVIKELKDYGVRVQIHDPFAGASQVHEEYGLSLTPLQELRPAQALIFCVAHEDYKKFNLEDYQKFCPSPGVTQGVIIDVKGFCPGTKLQEKNFRFWRL